MDEKEKIILEFRRRFKSVLKEWENSTNAWYAMKDVSQTIKDFLEVTSNERIFPSDPSGN